MNRQKISVIVPIYKTEKFLRKCIESVLNQTHTELEVILVDDGSPDKCGEICDEYAVKDSRVKVIHKENGGLFSAKNEGMKQATGEWVGFVDSDDHIDPEMYEYLLSLTDGDVDFAQCGFIVEEPDKQWLGPLPENAIIWNGGYDKIKRNELSFFTNHNWNKLYRRSLLEGLSFSSEYTLGEDLYFNIYVLNKFNKAVMGTKALYHYVQHENSMCHRLLTEKHLMSIFNVFQIAISVFPEDKVIHDFYLCQSFYNCIWICFKIVHGNSNEQTVIDNMRRYARKNFMRILFSDMRALAKLKLFLIAYFWRIYRILSLRARR